MSGHDASARFVHLHLHTHYSLLDGSIRVKNLVEQVSRLGMSSVAVTDHGNLFAAFQFHRAALAKGVRPVIGCEVYVAPGDHQLKERVGGRKPYDHLVLLAENDLGYRNLVNLVSRGWLEGFYHRPRISKELLADHADGLIGLSACLSGEVSRRLLARDPDGARAAAEQYREILGRDDFFLEIQDHRMVDEDFVRAGMVDLARVTGIPLVATNDCHFHHRDDMVSHRVMLGIGQSSTLDKLRASYPYNEEFYVKSAAEMVELFRPYPGATERTVEIAARCHVAFDTDTYHLPRYPVPEGYSPASFLAERAEEGLRSRLAKPGRRKRLDEEYWSRLSYELEVIGKMGFDGYFLVVWDFIRYARENGVPVGPGRGSAAGSVASWALGITDVDPLEYDLLFERFLNPSRISMPDIDIDFCQRKRERVIEYVRQLYGDDSVCQIATFNILKAKSAVRDVGRVMEMPFSDVDRIAKLIPEDLGITIEKALQDSAELREMADGDDDVRQLLDTAARLEGLARHCGIHAAGVVIAPEPLINLVPLNCTKDGEVTTQFDKDDIEELGLLKMDFLGLRTLTVMDDAVVSIRQTEGVSLDLAAVPLDDPLVYQLFSTGDTDGVFQFESSGMKEALRKVEPRSLLDLAALNALYRPGPMQFIDDFADRKHGTRSFSYIFPELEEILGETYGIIVYQEQVMQIAVKIAGFSLNKADLLRKAMGKKKQEIIDREAESFIAGGVANKHPEAKVRQLWDQILPFANYGFNKSHAVAYALVAYLTAYLKAHYPAHFMAAMLTSEVSTTDKLAQYLGRSREMGIRILPPDINRSQTTFTVEPDGIRFGLSAIKGVGLAAVEPILEAREQVGAFSSVAQCLRSLPARAVNHKVMEYLVKAGCFDAFDVPRKGLLERLEMLMEVTARERDQEALGQGFLFAERPSEGLEEEIRRLPQADTTERLAWEREVLGFFLSGHPLELYRSQLERFATATVSELRSLLAAGGESAVVGGLVTALRAIPIKKEGKNQGRKMAVFNLEDATGSVRVVVFPDTYDRFHHVLEEDRAVLLKATLRGDGDHVELAADELSELDAVESTRAAALRVELDLERVSEELVGELRDLLLAHPGPLPVRLELVRRGAFRVRLVPPPALTVSPSLELRAALAAVLGGRCYDYEFAAPAAMAAADAMAGDEQADWVN